MQIYCKLDNLQRTGSFKERGARNALAQLPDAQKKNGVIAASAGNHAQALAYQGRLLGVPATVVMPKFAPLIKINNCQKLGATVVLRRQRFRGSQSARARNRGGKRSRLHRRLRRSRDHRRPGYRRARDRGAGARSRRGHRAGRRRRVCSRAFRSR